MFERMTPPARLVVRDAQDIARGCGHGSMEPPNWPLALLRASNTEGYEALHQAGLRYGVDRAPRGAE